MNQEEQAKKTSQVISDAAVNEVIPAKRTSPTALSDEDLDKVAGGIRGVPIINTGIRPLQPDDYRDSSGK